MARSVDVQGDSNFVQGCSFSPDGLCVLTSTSLDNNLRIYNTPQSHGTDETVKWKAALTATACDSVRSYVWYPFMNSFDPASCIFLCAARDQPVHLFDAYNATIRATYRPYNALDEMESPSVVTFTPDGTRIFTAGFKSDRTIHVFDTNIPGRDSTILRLGKTRRSADGQKGLISALAFPNRHASIFAVGTFSPGSIYIYDDRSAQATNPVGTVLHGGLCVVGHGKGKKRRLAPTLPQDMPHSDMEQTMDIFNDELFSKAKVSWFQSRTRTGITQLTWADSSNSDFLLYSSSRRSDSVLAWDLRMLSGNTSHPIQGVLAYARDGDTNQKLQFTLHKNPRTQEEELITASHDQCVLIYHAATGRLLHTMRGFEDVVNGVSTHTQQDGTSLLAVSVGGRRFPIYAEIDQDEEEKDGVSPGYLDLYQVT